MDHTQPLARIADGEDKISLKPEQEQEDLAALFSDYSQSSDHVAKAARVYLAARKAKEDGEAHLKELGESLQTAEMALLQKMDEAGFKSARLDDGTLLSASSSVYYSLPAGGLDNANLHQWLIVAGGQDLVKSTIHHASFSSFCRELVVQGKAIHEAVKSITRRVVRVTKGKP